jgi:hypothetical protein
VFRDRFDVNTFQRGNIHTHSRQSDGDSQPEAVYSWYRDHGYNFLALTDHNKRTDPDLYRHVQRPGFVLIPGEEVTMKGGGTHVHVNALCHRRAIGGRRFGTVDGALRWGSEQAKGQGGIALVNHPNFYWAFGAEALPAAAAAGANLLEIWTGYLTSYPEGDASHPSVESMWDTALSEGMEFAAVAVDDMHNLGVGRASPRPGPARGWVYVFAQHATEPEICDGLARGWLIASSGVAPARLTVWGDTISLVANAPGGVVDFIGRDGVSLARQSVDPSGRPNAYRLRGGEDYVRARVTASDGTRAWTQAYRVTY